MMPEPLLKDGLYVLFLRLNYNIRTDTEVERLAKNLAMVDADRIARESSRKRRSAVVVALAGAFVAALFTWLFPLIGELMTWVMSHLAIIMPHRAPT